jgi:hypothetical protein
MAADIAVGLDAPIVVVHIDASGEVEYLKAGAVELLVVDDRCPNDRVYRMTVETSRADIADLLGDDMVGSRHDDRHVALSLRITTAAEGREHLSVVKP